MSSSAAPTTPVAPADHARPAAPTAAETARISSAGEDTSSSIPSPSTRPFRYKALAGLLAAVLGCTGAQLWYLGLPRAWVVLAFSLLTAGTALRAEAWYFSPAFFLFLIPVVGGFIHGLVLCLMSDEKFDARYNAGHIRRSRTGWLAVLIAIFTLAIGTSVLVTGLALFFQAIFERRWF